MEWMTVQEVRFSGAAYCGPCLAPLMEALLCAEDADPAIIEPDITADISSGDAEVRMTIVAVDPLAAMSLAIATLRSAISAAGDAASGWETPASVIHVAPADAADSLLVTAA
jgi:hypothetical protein